MSDSNRNRKYIRLKQPSRLELFLFSVFNFSKTFSDTVQYMFLLACFTSATVCMAALLEGGRLFPEGSISI